MGLVAQVQYIGQEDRVLIDVGSLSNGDTFNVSDEFAASLTTALPDSYVLVESTSAEADAPAATTSSSKKASKAADPAPAEADAAASDAAPSTNS
jgi:hypothetical protein